MKRLSILFVGLLSTVLIFSVAGMATEWDSANASITFDDVLVLLVDGNYEFPDITQGDLEEFTDGGDEALVSASSEPTVKVWTLTSDWKLGATYGTPDGNGNKATGLFELYGNKLVHFFDAINNYVPGDPATKPNTAVDITSDFGGGGSTHWPTAQQDTPSLSFNPSLLSEDISTGDTVNWRIDFWVYEGSIPSAS